MYDIRIPLRGQLDQELTIFTHKPVKETGEAKMISAEEDKTTFLMNIFFPQINA